MRLSQSLINHKVREVYTKANKDNMQLNNALCSL